MIQHTPGPWRKCGGSTPAYTSIYANRGYIVWQMADGYAHKENGKGIQSPDYEEQAANARLIAAAPDLLAACNDLLDMLEEWDTGFMQPGQEFAAVIAARNAIAKAGGQLEPTE